MKKPRIQVVLIRPFRRTPGVTLRLKERASCSMQWSSTTPSRVKYMDSLRRCCQSPCSFLVLSFPFFSLSLAGFFPKRILAGTINFSFSSLFLLLTLSFSCCVPNAGGHSNEEELSGFEEQGGFLFFCSFLCFGREQSAFSEGV